MSVSNCAEYLSYNGIHNDTARFDCLDLLNADFYQGLDTGWLIYTGGLVFFMQAGFTGLEAGAVRVKNLKHILLKNITDNVISAILFWSYGYAFAFGNQLHPFIGYANFFLGGRTAVGTPVPGLTGDSLPFWFFEYGFCAAATTILKGTLAERLTFPAYFILVSALSGFVYPVIVHWAWSPGGLLFSYIGITRNGFSYLDFAGSAVVHVVGGSSALVGVLFIGARHGRFDDSGKPRPMSGYSFTLITLGCFTLWFGWFGFNPGSTLSLNNGLGSAAAQAATTTLLATCTGGLTVFFFEFLKNRSYSLEGTVNGILGGLVAITGPCGYVTVWASFIIGIAAGAAYIFGAWFIIKMKIDDVVEAVPVHFFCGLAGAMLTGLFADQKQVSISKGVPQESVIDYGLLMGGGGRLFAVQILSGTMIVTWVMSTLGVVLTFLVWIKALRVSKDLEEAGIDSQGHGPCSWARVEMNDEGNQTEYQFRIQ